MTERLTILSLGAGVQSSTLALMALTGELPIPELVIFADPGDEDPGTYRYLDWLENEMGLSLTRVSAGNLVEDSLRSQVRGVKTDGVRWASMPYYTRDRITGKLGQIKRQCTKEYKIEPIEKLLFSVVREKFGHRAPMDCVEQWKGISADEVVRATPSKDKRVLMVYPLIDLGYPHTGEWHWAENLNQGDLYSPEEEQTGPKSKKKVWHSKPAPFDGSNRVMDRSACVAWLLGHGFPVPPRSKCKRCPYQGDEEWVKLRERPDEWAEVVQYDRDIRSLGGMRGDTFLHRTCVPLDEVVFRVADKSSSELPPPVERGWV